MGTSDRSEVGFTQLLTSGEKFPGVSNHAGTTEHPLSGRGVGWCRETLWDMAFLLIAPSITVGYEKVFGLVALWAHPHQASYQSLEEAACKLALLVDESMDWA